MSTILCDFLRFTYFLRMFMITPRLQCILNHVKGSVIADIGTDHAYIPIRLIEENRAKKVIASDIRQGPVEIAKNNIKKHNMQDKIEVRRGAGYSILSPFEADCIITAGMGGKLISEIIEDNKEIAKNAYLVLQPMNYQYELRKYLIKNGFTIVEEDISIEGFKVYNLLCVKSGIMKPFENEIDYHIPPYLKNHKYFKNLYDKKFREFSKITDGIENSKEKDVEKLEKYKFLLKELRKYESL